MKNDLNSITAKAVPENQRMDVADRLFGIRYPLQLEPTVYQFAEQLAEAYSGGYWHFYQLNNRGFYMAPDLEGPFAVVADNGFTGSMSADALGITACLYTYSNLSFGGGRFGDTCTNHYQWLYEFAMEHTEARSIRAAID